METETRSSDPGAAEVDVIVVGSGGAALVGAYTAARAGLETVVLERTEYLGGTSAYSGGALWLPGSPVQQRDGCTADSAESAREYLGAVLPDSADLALVDRFLAESGPLVEWLEEAPEIEFEWLPFPEYFDAPGRCPMGRSIQPKNIERSELEQLVAELVRPPVERDRKGRPGRDTLTGGQSLVGRLAAAVHGAGGQLRTGHRVVDLVLSDERVVGVVAEVDGQEITLRARDGVLLAAGGFESDPALRERSGVAGDAAWTMAPGGSTSGDVLLAAQRHGGATDLLSEAWYCPGLLQPEGRGSFTVGFRGGIMVDSTGRRFADETLPYDRFGRIMAELPGERIPSWLVFDSSEGGGLPAIAIPEGRPSEHLEAGTRVQADSIAELARAAGLPVEALEESVRRYNDFCGAGRDDDFGRGSDEYGDYFAGGPGASLKPVAEGPFFAAKFVLSDLGTKGGLVTDADGRVLREDGTALAGLYAAGNTAASMTRDVYPGPGAPLGTGMVFAHLAARDMAGGRESGRERVEAAADGQ